MAQVNASSARRSARRLGFATLLALGLPLIAHAQPWSVNGSEIYYTGGNVGIGTNDPDVKLHLQAGDFSLDNSRSLYFRASGTAPVATDGVRIYRAGGGSLRFAFRSSMIFDTLDTSSTIFRVNRADTNAALLLDLATSGEGFINVSGAFGIGFTNPDDSSKLDVNGKTRTTTLEITGGSDLSELFDVAGVVQPGTLVSIDPANPGRLLPSAAAYDRKVVGIVSGAGDVRPGMVMSQQGTLADGKYPVALTGRVYVQADASQGAIRPGDLLTSAELPGHAMRVADGAAAQGAIVGKAMTSLEQGQGLVMVLVSLQ